MIKLPNISKLLNPSKVVGMSIQMSSAESWEVNWCLIGKQKGQVEVLESCDESISREEVVGYTSKHPHAISVDGVGVIHKTIVFDSNDDLFSEENKNQLLSKVLPNASLEDFYLQVTPLAETSCMVSIVRRELLDEIVAVFTAKGIFVNHVSMGVASVSSILPLLDPELYEFSLPGNKISVDKGKLTKVEKVDEVSMSELKVGSLSLRPAWILPFSVALAYLVFPHNSEVLSAEIVNNRSEYKDKQFIKVSGATALGLSLLILLINFLIYSSYRDKYSGLTQEVDLNKGALERIEELRIRLGDKKSFFLASGLTGDSKSSLYADNIANALPASISLKKLMMTPVIRSANIKKDLEFQNNVIRVQGLSNKSTELNSWMNEMRDMEWVSDVAVVNYSAAAGSNASEFEVEIRISNKE